MCCDEDKLRATVERIHDDPSARVFLMGDLCEYIPRKEWRWNEEIVATWVDRTDVGQSELEYLQEILKPITPKLLGAIQGNHELELQDTWNQNVHGTLCRKLHIRDLGYSALVRMNFAWERKGGAQEQGIDIYLHHGWGGGRTDGADLARFSELERDYEADWYIAGHTHRYMAAKALRYRLSPRTGKLEGVVRLRGRSGTFLKTIVEGARNYPEKKAMRPLVTGALCVRYSPGQNDAEAII